MKKTVFSIIFIFSVIAISFSSCTLETSDNGKLDGFWHLVSEEVLSADTTIDLSGQRIFWGVEYKLLNVSDKDGVYGDYYLRFNHDGDSLRVYSPYKNNWHENGEDGGDITVEDASVLLPFGISALDETFLVEQLGSSKMVLKSSAYRLRFKKF